MDKTASNRLFWLLFGLGLLFFGISRWLLQTQLAPSFDPDTYKYLSGAYALWQDQPLPAIFTTKTNIDGILHFVPGYSWFIAALWTVLGQASLWAVISAQSVISLLGYSVFSWLMAHWFGRWLGLSAWLILLSAPALAWLEHTVMPEALTVPLLFISIVICWVLPPRNTTWPVFLGAILLGCIMAIEILLRTSSQAFIPVLPLLAYLLRQGHKPFILWLIGFAFGFGATLTPWMLHNYIEHQSFRVAASTGRNLYFSAVWSNTIDNEAYLAQHHLQGIAPIMVPYIITEHAFRQQLQTQPSIAKADAQMLSLALSAYQQHDLTTLLQHRWQIFQSLFDPAADTHNRLEALGPMTDYYLANLWASSEGQQWALHRFGAQLPDSFWQQLPPSQPDSAAAKGLVKQWIAVLLFDGMPLLRAYSIATLVLLFGLRGLPRQLVSVTLILPPLLFMAAYSLMGAPLYRYQIELHPFMLLTVILALMHLGWRFYNTLQFQARSA